VVLPLIPTKLKPLPCRLKSASSTRRAAWIRTRKLLRSQLRSVLRSPAGPLSRNTQNQHPEWERSDAQRFRAPRMKT
jgi:hypothetical protein